MIGRLGILVGVDGSEQALHAVDWAARESATRRLPLTVCHVLRYRQVKTRLTDEALHGVIDAGEVIVDQGVARAVAAGATEPVTGRLECGGATEALLGLASGAVEVVIGARGSGGFDRLRLGSVGSQVTAHAHCPVTVVRGRSGDSGVLVGVDGSDRSRAALEYGFRFAAAHQVSLQALYVYPELAMLPVLGYPPALDPDADRRAAQRLVDEAVAPLAAKFPDVAVEATVTTGYPAGTLAVASPGATLLVVGSRGHGGFTGLLLGSVSQAALRHAHCPVTVVH